MLWPVALVPMPMLPDACAGPSMRERQTDSRSGVEYEVSRGTESKTCDGDGEWEGNKVGRFAKTPRLQLYEWCAYVASGGFGEASMAVVGSECGAAKGHPPTEEWFELTSSWTHSSVLSGI